jgi:hypothetical protein
MPPTPLWFNKIEEIKSKIEAVNTPNFDRSTIAEMFGICYRQAAALSHVMGAEKSGGAFIVPRARLIAYLNGRAEADHTREEQERRKALGLKLAEIRAAGPPLRAARLPGSKSDSPLPAGVSVVGPGELRVLYDSPDTVLGVILALAELSEINSLAFAASLEYRPPEGEEDE